MKIVNEYFEAELRQVAREHLLDTIYDREQFANLYNIERLERQLVDCNGYKFSDVAIIELNGFCDAHVNMQELARKMGLI